MNRNLIIALIAIVVIIAAALFIFSQPATTTTDGKINTQINFLSKSTLQNGEQVQFELKDTSGKAIAGQNVTIAYDDGSGNVQNYKIITDQNGKGYLAIQGEAAGKYDITVTYGGNDQYNGCTGKMTITVEDGTTSTQSTETESNSTANTVMYNNDTTASQSTDTSQQQASQSQVHQTYYDAELNVYYDENGIVIGGQEPGVSIYELRNRAPMQEEGT